jgi:transcriptional regulator with XRE-family HTH domain
MIKNERQYRITKAEAEKFSRLIRELERESSSGSSVPQVIRAAEINGLQSQLADLLSEISEYDSLRNGKDVLLDVGSFQELPQALVRARIAAGLTQKELAVRLQLKEQQIQKYEATGYAGASVARLMEIAEALNLRIRKDVFIPAVDLGSFDVFKRLAEIGIERDFVLKRLVSASTAAKARSSRGAIDPSVVFEATTAASHIFGWTPEAIIGGDSLFVDQGVLGAARFKVNKRAEEKRLSAYTFYAHHLALQLLEATSPMPKPIPVDYRDFRAGVIAAYASVNFENVLRYAWDLGIVVLPLKDAGAFHGAMWRVKGQNIVVLKQTTKSIDRWLHDLLHEAFHAGQEPHLTERTLIEASEISGERRESDEEWDATQFAADVVLDGRAEELAKACVNATKANAGASGSIERLKTVVPDVAANARVPVGALANYMAYRLSLQNIDWWGAAQKLQSVDLDPWSIARDILLQRVQLSRIRGFERDLLLRAISDSDLPE